MNIILRKARPDDRDELQNLAIDTICKTCRRDYTESQIGVWTTAIRNNGERWHKSLLQQYFLVAEFDGKIVGFASLDGGSYVDFLYVHKDYTGLGVARTLFEALQREALAREVPQLTSHVSKTAMPFFGKMGFNILQENIQNIDGIEISNFLMEKILRKQE